MGVVWCVGYIRASCGFLFFSIFRRNVHGGPRTFHQKCVLLVFFRWLRRFSQRLLFFHQVPCHNLGTFRRMLLLQWRWFCAWYYLGLFCCVTWFLSVCILPCDFFHCQIYPVQNKFSSGCHLVLLPLGLCWSCLCLCPSCLPVRCLPLH